MKSIIKWVAVCGVGFFLLVAIIAVAASQLIDVKKYKPQIEKMVSEATGRSFSMGENIDLSVFPWVGVTLSDIQLGNPEGYSEENMVAVKSFEVRVKVIPLFSKKIEIKTFVLDRPEVYLEKRSGDQANWMNIGNTGKKAPATSSGESAGARGRSQSGSLPIAGLTVANFAVTDGGITYVDKTSGVTKTVSDITMKLSNVTLETPIGVLFKALIDGHPVSIEGSAGPFGKTPGKGTIPMEFTLKALSQIKATLKGSLTDPLSNPVFDFTAALDPFSPKTVMKSMKIALPLIPKDDSVLSELSFFAGIKGSLQQVQILDGKMILDDTTLRFSADIKEFDRPNIGFDLQLDRLDLDRYMPGSSAEKEAGAVTGSKTDSAKPGVDYAPLRKLAMRGQFKAEWLRAGGAVIENIQANVSAENAKIVLDPFRADFYQGKISSLLAVNVQNEVPDTSVTFEVSGVQAAGVIQDVMKKELIEGGLDAKVVISMTGDDPERIKKTISGKGEMKFTDGAVIGIDLANAVRNVQAAVGLAEKPTEKPRTDFAELKVPFTIQNGLVNTSGSSLASPLVRVIATGDVDLVKEILDVRVEPKFVATLTGQGDTKERSGIMVPVTITGTFASPKIRPDLKNMLSSEGKAKVKKQLESIAGNEEARKEKVESVKKELESATQDVEKKVKGLIPGLLK